jgi:restriction endonuclease S subunit
VKAEDILMTVVGMKFGKTAIIYGEDCPAIFSCKSTLLRNSKVNIYYLVTYLSSNVGYGLLRRGQRGAAQPGINLFDIRNVPVPIFSEDFQSEIASLVCRAKLCIVESSDVYQKAQELLLSDLGLSDWEPKHQLFFVKNYSDSREVGRTDAEYFQPKYDEIGKAIKSYRGGWDTLGNIASVKKCVEVGSEAYMDEGEIPFIRVSNLSPFEITEEKYIFDELYAKLSQHQPQQGEILFSKDGTSGIAYHLKEKPKKMIPSGGILRLKIRNKQINEDYLTLVLNSLIVQEQINRDVGGSIILHWRPEQVKQTLIPILDDKKQQQIQQKVTESFNLRKQSKLLLECAKRAVEIAIEQNEDAAIKWLQENTKEVGHGEQDDSRHSKRLNR